MSSHASSHDAHEIHSDFEGAKIAMWLFLFTELLLFGGLFIVYAVYRSKFPAEFAAGSFALDRVLGVINTAVLLTSSLTVVLGIEALQRGKTLLAKWMVGLTVIAAGIFMVNKYFEWSHKFHLGLYPGGDGMLNLPEGMLRSGGEIMFYNLYYFMTGLHGVHVLVGMGLLIGVLYFMNKRPYKRGVTVADDASDEFKLANLNPRNVSKLENVGLYWHLVDVIWIFLFPLIYLI